jgi:hypothetical protein
MENKICSSCSLNLPVSEFCKNKSTKDGLNRKCKQCEKIKHQKWYADNAEKIKEKSSYSFEKHKEYYSKNKDKKIKYTIEYTRNRIKNDPQYKVRHDLGVKLGFLLRCIKGSNNFLGCDLIYFINYIENQFDGVMTWDNHGSVWELDHIIPISSFDLLIDEEQNKCFHYTNLRPIFKTTEIAKSFGSNNKGNRNKLNKHE